ncbi:MAG: DUF4340 domain-containing protein [Pseudobutyrivibrio sp.]|nr:DUF4340 domain-containing protein [Pseudobutyrivibrio sp.]
MKRLIDASKIKLVLVIIFIILVIVFALLLFKNKGADTSPSLEDKQESTVTHAQTLDETSEVEDSGEQIFMMPKDEIYEFSMTDANGILLKFVRHGNDWVYEDDETLDINEDRIDKVLNYLSDVRFVDSFQTDDGDEYGLGQASRMFVMTDANGYQTIISLGNTSEDGKVYFAINYDFNTVYVNSGKLSNVGDYYIEELVAF